jgi:hypothetical protein
VPRYYFNVCCDGFEATDICGAPCRDDLEALDQAMRTASEVVQKRLHANELSNSGWVEVEDERHRPVLRLPLRAAAY